MVEICAYNGGDNMLSGMYRSEKLALPWLSLISTFWTL